MWTELSPPFPAAHFLPRCSAVFSVLPATQSSKPRTGEWFQLHYPHISHPIGPCILLNFHFSTYRKCSLFSLLPAVYSRLIPSWYAQLCCWLVYSLCLASDLISACVFHLCIMDYHQIMSVEQIVADGPALDVLPDPPHPHSNFWALHTYSSLSKMQRLT